jgi:hypothetical protein
MIGDPHVGWQTGEPSRELIKVRLSAGRLIHEPYLIEQP